MKTRREALKLIGKGGIVATGIALIGPGVALAKPKMKTWSEKTPGGWKRYYAADLIGPTISKTEMLKDPFFKKSAYRAMERARDADGHKEIKAFSRDIPEELFMREEFGKDYLIYSAYLK